MHSPAPLRHGSITLVLLLAISDQPRAAAQTTQSATPTASIEKRLNFDSLNSRALNPDSLSSPKTGVVSSSSISAFDSLQHSLTEKDLLSRDAASLLPPQQHSLHNLAILPLSSVSESVKEQKAAAQPKWPKLSSANANGTVINKAFDAR